MKYLLPSLALLVSLIPEGLHAAEKDFEGYYPYITSMDIGEPLWYENPPSFYEMGVKYRAVILVEEVYRSLIIETIQLGDEGSAKFTGYTRTTFGTSKLNFKKWKSPTSFLLEVNGKARLFEIKDGHAIIDP